MLKVCDRRERVFAPGVGVRAQPVVSAVCALALLAACNKSAPEPGQSPAAPSAAQAAPTPVPTPAQNAAPAAPAAADTKVSWAEPRSFKRTESKSAMRKA